MTIKKALPSLFHQSFLCFLKKCNFNKCINMHNFVLIKFIFLPDFIDQLLFALSVCSIGYTEEP